MKILDYKVNVDKKHMLSIWIQKCVLALIFANAFKITN